MKEFDANEHMSCPACGFETVIIDAEHNRIALVRKDGQADAETWERDLEAKPDDVSGIYCNSKYCGVKIG